MIKYEENREFNTKTGQEITTMLLLSNKKDRYTIAKIKRIIKLIVDKRNNEEKICEEITILLDECMRDYYSDLKKRV